MKIKKANAESSLCSASYCDSDSNTESGCGVHGSILQ